MKRNFYIFYILCVSLLLLPFWQSETACLTEDVILLLWSWYISLLKNEIIIFFFRFPSGLNPIGIAELECRIVGIEGRVWWYKLSSSVCLCMYTFLVFRCGSFLTTKLFLKPRPSHTYSHSQTNSFSLRDDVKKVVVFSGMNHYNENTYLPQV